MGDLAGNPFSQLFPTAELAVEYRNMNQETRKPVIQSRNPKQIVDPRPGLNSLIRI